ncbi:MAG TPA: MarR family transcriptional regulator [Symbiobacteriaceae bacterium]|jgi:DNA-binding MarR family transcriptional regulator
MPELRAEIGELWRSVHREMHERFKHAFRGQEMPGALMFLRHIDLEPGATVSELARRSGMVKSHVSNMLEQLFRMGYIEKRSDPADQRLLRIYPTPAVAEIKAAMEARFKEVWAVVMDEIPEGQLADVARGFQILLAALEKANGKVNKDESRG